LDRILIDLARRKHSKRRNASPNRRKPSDEDLLNNPTPDELLDLDEPFASWLKRTLRRLSVKLRVFAGMTVEEVAHVQGISPRTVKRNWAYARAWLGAFLPTMPDPSLDGSTIPDRK